MSKTAIITFMRCQLPHIGHGLVFDFMLNAWKHDPTNSAYFIYLSKTQNKTNPLKFSDKLSLAKTIFPLHHSRFVETHSGTIIGILKELDSRFESIKFVCGPDRHDAFDKLINAYNNIEYSFKNITVISVGDRSISTDIGTASGTLMREAIKTQDKETFAKYLPKNLSCKTKDSIFNSASALMVIKGKIK